MYLCAAARDWEFAGADIVAALRLVFCVHSAGVNGVEQHGHITLAMHGHITLAMVPRACAVVS